MSPRFRLLRNTMGDDESQKRSISVSLVGGNDKADATEELSARDAIGATLIATSGDGKRAFQLSRWEGLATQNSKWIHIGTGTEDKIGRLDITWPSGKKTVHENIATGSHVTLFEDGSAPKFKAAR